MSKSINFFYCTPMSEIVYLPNPFKPKLLGFFKKDHKADNKKNRIMFSLFQPLFISPGGINPDLFAEVQVN